MRSLLRIALMLPLLAVLAGPILADPVTNLPSSGEYLTWLSQRSNLWVSEMAQLEAHQHGQYKADYRRLQAQVAKVHQQTQTLKSATTEQERKQRKESLIATVSQVEQGLEFLLSETPQVANQCPQDTEQQP